MQTNDQPETLMSDKMHAFDEAYRTLKPGNQLSLSEVVLTGDLPDGIRQAADRYAGNTSGIIQEQMYLDMLAMAGFNNVQIQERKAINLPDDLLRQHLTDEQIAAYRQSGAGIFSLTVSAEKPADHIPVLDAGTADSAGNACYGPDYCA